MTHDERQAKYDYDKDLDAAWEAMKASEEWKIYHTMLRDADSATKEKVWQALAASETWKAWEQALSVWYRIIFRSEYAEEDNTSRDARHAAGQAWEEREAAFEALKSSKEARDAAWQLIETSDEWKAYEAVREVYFAAVYHAMSSSEKAREAAWEAVEASPEYKAHRKACQLVDDAENAFKATDVWKAWNIARKAHLSLYGEDDDDDIDEDENY